MSRKEESPYIFDQKLIPRIKLYLTDKKADSLIDPDLLARHLQTAYRSDYGRKKRTVFIHSVSKALEKARVEMFGEEALSTPSKRQRPNSSSDSDPEPLVCYENTNGMNIAMRNLYKSSPVDRDKPGVPVNRDSHGAPVNRDRPERSLSEISENACSSSKKKKKKQSAATAVSKKEMSQHLTQSLLWTVDRVGYNGTDSGQEHSSGSFKNKPSVKCSNQKKLLDASLRPSSDVELESNHISAVVNLEMDQESGSRQSQRDSGNKVSDRKALDSSVTEAELNRGTSAAKERGKRKKGKELADTEVADIVVTNPTKHFEEFGGNEDLIDELCEMCDDFSCPDIVLNHDCHAQPDSILLYGPSGSGKRLLAECMAGYLNIPVVQPFGHVTKLVSGMSGDSEQRIRNLFDQTAGHAPCILFLNEIEGVAPNQDIQTSSDMVNRMISQLCSSVKQLQQNQERILVVAATNKIEAVDKRVRDCFTEMKLNMPDERAREAILRKLCAKNWAIAADYDLKTLAMLTPAFVAGDLNKLVRVALRCCRTRMRAFHRKNASNVPCTKERRIAYKAPV